MRKPRLTTIVGAGLYVLGIASGAWVFASGSDSVSATGVADPQALLQQSSQSSAVQPSEGAQVSGVAAQVGLSDDFPELRLARHLVNNRRVEAARVTHFDQHIVHTTITHACTRKHGVVQYSQRQSGEFAHESNPLMLLETPTNKDISSIEIRTVAYGAKTEIGTNVGTFDVQFFSDRKDNEISSCAAFVGYPQSRANRVAGYYCTHGSERMDVGSTKNLIEALILSGKGVEVTAV